MADELMNMLGEWVAAEEGARADKFDGYVYGIAQARYVIRRIFRMVDDEAKTEGLDPLQHQALLQVFGSPDRLTISGLAERLDIVPALASRTVNELERRGLVTRHRDTTDKRVIGIRATSDTRDLLQRIDTAVHTRVERFQSGLTDDQRRAALVILTFYIGLGSPSRLAAIMTAPSTGTTRTD
ncbi:MarR family winged helix-turn-helix transcriptional regulator [Nocardia sp. NPDC003963]